MQKINAKIKTFEEVWRDDKELVRLSHPDLKIDWNAQLPNQRDAYSMLITKSQQWQNPAESFQLNESSLAEVLDFLVPEVENVFEDRLQESPFIEILSQDDYLPRINELEREINEQFGYGKICRSPPTMYHFPSHGILLMPEKYLVRVPKGSSQDVGSADFDVMELTWDRSFFEEVLCEELSHAIFRQIRSEWKEDYVRSMKAVGHEGEAQISSINEAIAQYVKENITRTARNQWGLYVASEKIAIAWQNRLGMNNYLGIEALSAHKKLSQVSMVDYISLIGQQTVFVLFNSLHPNYELKQQRFNSKNLLAY